MDSRGPFTVAELLARPELSGARLLASREAAASRVIEGASVQEAPVEDFVRPDELVMTTALGLDEPTDLVRFVEEVARSGAAALAVARPERPSPILPAAAIEAAERLELPLIELPWKLRFSEVTELVLRRVIEEQTTALRAARELAAKAVGLDPEGTFVAISLRCSAPDGVAAEALDDAVRAATERAVAVRRLAALQSWRDGEGTIVLCLKAASMLRPLISALMSEIESSLRSRARGASVACGVGQPCTAQGIPRSLHEARTAMRLTRVGPEASAVVHYEDLGITAALHDVMDGSPGALDELRERCLGPVLEYERTRGLPLTETLQALFAESGNVSSTARRLRINRQSLLYRLDKLRKLTGLDLARPTDRLALELALNSWQVKADSLSVTTTSAGR